jgi:hypothetical protein
VRVGGAVAHQAGGNDIAEVVHVAATIEDGAPAGIVAEAFGLSGVARGGGDDLGPVRAEVRAEVAGALAGGGSAGAIGVCTRDQEW